MQRPLAMKHAGSQDDWSLDPNRVRVTHDRGRENLSMGEWDAAPASWARPRVRPLFSAHSMANDSEVTAGSS